MSIRHPFEWLPSSARKHAFALLFILTLAVMVNLQVLGGPLINEVAPSGIVSYEFAGDLSTAQAMVDSWGETGRVYAGLSLGADYLFLFCYASAISLGCVLVAQGPLQSSTFLVGFGSWLAWAQFAAALLDALENYALIRVLLGSAKAYWPVVAQLCAAPKFVFVALGLVYVLVGGLIALVLRVRGSSEPTD